MLFKQTNHLKWLEFELLEGCPIIHACFMRHGGVSEGPLTSLNLGGTLDELSNIQTNRRLVLELLAIPELLSARICHGKTITKVPNFDFSLPLSDGLSTAIPNLGLMVTHADCQAAIFYDPIKHVFANIHCGWRGNVQNIYHETVLHMQKTYDSKPENLLVCISPSLGPENAEFKNYRTELPNTFWDFQPQPEYFDLWSISEWQLKNAGILPHHIQIARIDTFANPDDYFSYRRSNICGRQATICALKSR